MIRSMTGFGRETGENEEFSLALEIKTVNHKYLDFHIKMPLMFNFMEEEIKKYVKKYILRGRVEIFVKLEKNKQTIKEIKVDVDLASQLYRAMEYIKNHLNFKDPITLQEIVSYPGIIEFDNKLFDNNVLKDLILKTLEDAIKELIYMREIEGISIQRDFNDKLDQMDLIILKINELSPDVYKRYEDKLKSKIKELIESNTLSDERIAMEVAVFADKVDINEECVRLKSHIDQFRKTMKRDESIGRKLDFIIQEMNREINTICSKSNHESITVLALDLKSLIEKLREQTQNVE